VQIKSNLDQDMEYLLACKQDNEVSHSVNCWTGCGRAKIFYYLFIY